MESLTINSPQAGERTSTFENLLEDVSSALAKRAGKDIFAIEGHIGDQDDTASSSGGHKLTIRWDDKAKGHARTLRLPLSDDTVAQDSFHLLLDACQPATFGFGTQEILDEEYRKAGKLDTDDFCTDFNPYEHGIVNTINQVLAQGSHSTGRGLGVKAELYKLNVGSSHNFWLLGVYLLIRRQGILCSFWQVQTPCRHSAIRLSDGLACGLSACRT